MEWIKSLHVDKNKIYKEKKLKFSFKFYLVDYFFFPSEMKIIFKMA